MNSKKSWTLIISVALIFPLVKMVKACADGPDPYDYYPSFFQNGVTAGAAAYTPFFYTRYLDYYDDWYDYKNEDSLPDANILEWQAFTANAVPVADLDSFIYKYSYADLSSLYAHIDKGGGLKISPEMSSNAFTKWLESRRDLEALGYLMYAKQCEPNATAGEDWEAPKRDTARMSRLSKNGLQLYNAAKQDFFKNRFAYQAMRMAFYNGRNQQTLELYNMLIGDKKAGGEMYARCLGLKAGALFRTGHKAEAAYLYSRVFDLSDAGKRSAFISYDWAKGFENGQVLQLCKSPHERAVVHLMAGLHDYDKALPELQAAFTADPQAKGLDVLMTREIQKAEERYQEPKLLARRGITPGGWYYERYDGWGENDAQTKKEAAETERGYGGYLKQLASFAETAAGSDKVTDKAFWHLSSAYIALMQNDEGGAKKYLDIAAAAGMSTREHDLHDIINTLCIIKRAPKITPEVESELLPSIKWLDAQAARSKAFSKTYTDLMSTVLVDAYLRDKDTVRAIYVLARATRSADGSFSAAPDFLDLPGALLERVSIAGLQSSEAFAASGGKTPYERWLLSRSPYSASVLKELEGTKYLRQHQFQQAAQALSGVSKADLHSGVLPDPFFVQVLDIHTPDDADSAHGMTKLAFAKKMMALEGRIAKSPDDAQSLFDYGVGLYNMTYYGKASSAFAYYRSSVDDYGYHESPERRTLPDYLQDYYSAQSAEQFFIKTMAVAKDENLKAKCIWMAAKCWQKRCPVPAKTNAYEWNDTAYYRYSVTNPYFAQMQLNAGGAAFFSDARSTCGYFRDYLGKRK